MANGAVTGPGAVEWRVQPVHVSMGAAGCGGGTCADGSRASGSSCSGDDADDLVVAKFLVDNIVKLRRGLNYVNTAQEEEKLATEIRDFLGQVGDKLPAYAALAMLVPEEDRAVELRMNSIKEGQLPLRFSYIQDGRTPHLLYATGFAKAALSQFKQFGSLLKAEDRLQIGNLLKEVSAQLGSASPDPFLLDQAMDAYLFFLIFF